MTSTVLDNLARIGKLKPFAPNRSEFEQLLIDAVAMLERLLPRP